MSVGAFEFVWTVAGAGYEWIDVKVVGAREADGSPAYWRVLVERNDSSELRSYDPLREQPTLFQAFAEVSPTEKGVLDFATRWGALGQFWPGTVGAEGRR